MFAMLQECLMQDPLGTDQHLVMRLCKTPSFKRKGHKQHTRQSTCPPALVRVDSSPNKLSPSAPALVRHLSGVIVCTTVSIYLSTCLCYCYHAKKPHGFNACPPLSAQQALTGRPLFTFTEQSTLLTKMTLYQKQD